MKALVYLGPRRMELQTAPDPVPGPGEVAVHVSASAICGSDLHGFREASPRRIPPLVMGHEVAGRVDALGGGVNPDLMGRRVVVKPVVSCGACDRCAEGRPNLCPDRRLMGMNFPGAFAEVCVVPASNVLTIPDDLPDDVAALTEPLANAVHVVSGAVQAADRVLVIGAGAIGLLAIRAAALAGASPILVADPIRSRLDIAAAQGGEALDPGGDAPTAILEATDGTGVDVVVDAAGFPSTWELGLKAVRNGGRIEVLGLGAREGSISFETVVAKGVTVTGSYACTDPDFDRAVSLLRSGEVDPRPWISHMALEDGQRAFETLVDGTDVVKVILRL